MALLLALGWTIMIGPTHAVDANARSVPGVLAVAPEAARLAERHWVTDPAAPGDDLPPRGRSLFDFLVMQKRRGNFVPVVPFPFAALLQHVDAQMQQHPGSKALKAVLIPFGRSLQKNSAAPDFFAYPRAVVAVDAEPADTSSLYLKDRLYLGYQEKTSLLEVISYNEDAARFEFEVVTDYRPGGTPRIAYANRTLCIACHQNAAPIFSRPGWDETNANPRVAALLLAEGKDFYGIPVERGVDVPDAIDNAVLRANRFAVAQLLWNEGCGGSDEPALRCRAGLFVALLQYRLSGQQQFDRTATSYRSDIVASALDVARRRWPGGLAIGNPDLPNRNPLSIEAMPTRAFTSLDFASLVHVGTAFDPLHPRPPLEVWRVAESDDIARLVTGLAEFIAETDVERLDRTLFARAATHGAGRRTLRAACAVQPALATGGTQRVEFRCASSSNRTDSGVSVAGRLIVVGNRVARGTIDRLVIGGQPPLRDIDLSAGRVDARGEQRAAALALRRGRMHARGGDGNALERIELRWGKRDGQASLLMLEDFAPARNAIDALVRDNLAGKFDGFDALAFRRARLMPAMLTALGASPGAWCCLDTSGMPPAEAARIDARGAHGVEASSTTVAAHADFYRYCAECHLGSERAPPNFLLGDPQTVEAKLRHCAPRIFVRLSMWHSGPAARAKTPMPPEIALRRLEVAPAAWRDGDALAALLRSAKERLAAEAGSGRVSDALLQGYETLRACLPDETMAAPPQRLAPEPKPSPHAARLDR